MKVKALIYFGKVEIMNSKTKHIVGWTILLLLCISIFTSTVIYCGLKITLIGYALGAGLTILVNVAAKLINSGD